MMVVDEGLRESYVLEERDRDKDKERQSSGRLKVGYS